MTSPGEPAGGIRASRQGRPKSKAAQPRPSVLVAIVGFGIGALVGSSADDQGSSTADDTNGAPPGSPDDGEDADPDDAEGEESTEDGDEPSVSVTMEMDGSAPAGEELEYTVRTDPPQPGLVLGVERRQPGGDDDDD